MGKARRKRARSPTCDLVLCLELRASIRGSLSIISAPGRLHHPAHRWPCKMSANVATATSKGGEPLLDDADRYCMFPLKEDAVWRQYKKAEVTFWTAEDVDLSKDSADWQDQLEAKERSFISSLLAYQAAAEKLILHNTAARFMVDVELAEARAFYAFMIFKQGVHSEMIGTIMATLFTGREEQMAAVLRTVKDLPAFQRKVDWVRKRIHSGATFPERLVAFAAVASVFNAGTFVGLYWFKKRGLLRGVGHATDLISRDEGINVEAAGVMYSLIRSRLPDEAAQGIVREAVDIEGQFVCDELPLDGVGLSKADMREYLHYVGDRLLGVLGHPPMIGAKSNPFPWLEDVALQTPEVKVAAAASNIIAMSKAGALAVSVGGQAGGLSFDEDF